MSVFIICWTRAKIERSKFLDFDNQANTLVKSVEIENVCHCRIKYVTAIFLCIHLKMSSTYSTPPTGNGNWNEKQGRSWKISSEKMQWKMNRTCSVFHSVVELLHRKSYLRQRVYWICTRKTVCGHISVYLHIHLPFKIRKREICTDRGRLGPESELPHQNAGKAKKTRKWWSFSATSPNQSSTAHFWIAYRELIWIWSEKEKELY